MKLKRIFIDKIEDWKQTRPLSIVGATGSGKTSTLITFLRKNKLNPLLVSLDSVAAYQELNIGSSKPLGADYSDFQWAGLSFASPNISMNALLMKEAIAPHLEHAFNSKNPIVFIGGTHFYERFIIEGAAPGGASDETFLGELARRGKELVHAELVQVDKRWADFLHLNDEYRIFRYGDLVLRQGLDYDTLRAGSQNPLVPEIDCLIMNSEKEFLEPRLKQRIQEMMNLGWLEETKNLLAKYGSQAPALKTIGYHEIVSYLSLPEDEQNMDDLLENIHIRHRQLAKQQRTWLRKLNPKQ